MLEEVVETAEETHIEEEIEEEKTPPRLVRINYLEKFINTTILWEKFIRGEISIKELEDRIAKTVQSRKITKKTTAEKKSSKKKSVKRSKKKSSK